VLLLGALAFSLLAQAQQQPERRFRLQSTDLAITYTAEGGKLAFRDNRFWMQGGSAEAAFTFYRGLGVAFNLSGERATGLSQSVGFSKITLVAGPRYSYSPARWLGPKHAITVFGESLFGTVHGFNGLFPAGNTARSSADAAAMQVGGGVNVPISKGFGLRAFQLDYVRTNLPNSATNLQHDLRMGMGFTYHIPRF
jgi:hypothetical protein